jgi:hypothetical protein
VALPLFGEITMLEQIKPTTLAEYVGTQFQVLADWPTPIFFTLTEIKELAKTERQEIFSYFFQGPASVMLPQGTYRLKHEKFGEIDLFFVPVARNKDGFEYECAFNNLI